MAPFYGWGSTGVQRQWRHSGVFIVNFEKTVKAMGQTKTKFTVNKRNQLVRLILD